jgi:predicted FMN-binding regulatory protein PaiB
MVRKTIKIIIRTIMMICKIVNQFKINQNHQTQTQTQILIQIQTLILSMITLTRIRILMPMSTEKFICQIN